MDIYTHIERAEQLIETRRYDMALKELQLALAIDPQNTNALDVIAGCYYEMGKYKLSLEYAKKYLGVYPDSDRAHYMVAINLYQTDAIKEAKNHIDKAISIDPEFAGYRALRAGFYIDDKEWEKAVAEAEMGLSFDPEDAQCLNYRNLALTKLGRADELLDSIGESLAANPDDATTHATIGWAKLETRKYKEAKFHFAEALRLEPHNDWARAGMVEALKAKNIIYRGFLAYFFWIANHKSSAQWAIIVVIYVGMRLLKNVAKTMPILYIPYALIALAAYLTWIIEPVFNLFVLADPYGKYLLNKREKTGALLVGSGVGLAIVFALAMLVTKAGSLFYPILYFATVVIPVATFFGLEEDSKQLKKIGIYTLSLVVIGCIATMLLLLNINGGVQLLVLYGLGIFTFGWVANYLATK